MKQYYNRLLVFSIILYSALSLTVYGQIDTLLIDDIEISEPRLSTRLSESARNIDIISKEQISKSSARNVSELLQYVGSVDLRRRGVGDIQSDVSLRGGTFNQVLIMINGVKMIDPQTGHHNFNIPLDILSIERIEVIKGPAARIYGQNAFSGAINIITKIRKEDEIDLNLHTSIGAWNTISSGVSIVVPNDTYNQQISLSHNSSDGYRHNTDYKLGNIYYQSQLNLGTPKINLTAGYSDREFGANAFYANERATEQFEEVKTYFGAIETTLLSNSYSLTPRFSYRRNEDHYVYLRNKPSVYENNHTSEAIAAELHGKYASNYGESGLGIEFNNQTLESNNLGERDRSIVGIYAEHRAYLMHDILQVTLGAYLNKFSDQDLKIYPGLDLSYELNTKATLFASYNHANRIPTYTNLYYSSPVEQGNAKLTSETISAFEIGGRYNTDWISCTLSGFYNDAGDLIDWAKNSANDKVWNAVNLSQIESFGLDLSINMDIAKRLNLNNYLGASLNYNYIDATLKNEAIDLVSRYALENLRHQLMIRFDAEILNGISLHPSLRYIDRVSLNDYSLLDLKVSYDTQDFSLYINAINLTDVEYKETNLVVMPGRHFSVGIIMR